MTENEAILSLVNEINGEEEVEGTSAEPQVEQAQPETKETANENPFDAEKLKVLMADAMRSVEAQKAEQAKAEQEAQKPNLPPEQQAFLDSLGIGNIGQIQEQLKAFQEAQEAQLEAKRQQEVFDKNSVEFKKDFPTIKLEELGEFAEKNGFLPLLSEDYLGWKAVATAMINLAKSNEKPDEIIGDNRVGNEISAFERQQKGEHVSDVELGAELLKSANII